jgi:uncharacterized protein YyaL (SSP411 family)
MAAATAVLACSMSNLCLVLQCHTRRRKVCQRLHHFAVLSTLAMGQAFLALYEVTGARDWLKRAEAARQFVAGNFALGDAGFVTSKVPTDRAYKPHPERDENSQFARFANLLYQYTGQQADRDAATHAMRYLATREVAIAWLSAPVLLAEMQFTRLPTHITIVGAKKDPLAKVLFQAALSTGAAYKRVEWWDPSEGPLSRADVQDPSVSHSEAFLCTVTACSSPISNPQVLEARLHKPAE